MSSATEDEFIAAALRFAVFPASLAFGRLCLFEDFPPVCVAVRFSADDLPFREDF